MSDPAASRVSFEDLDPLQQPSQPKANRDNMLRGSVSTGGLRAKAFGRASSIGTNLLGKASALSSQHEQFSAVTQGLNRAQGFLSSHQQTRSPYDNISASSSTASASRLRLLTSSGRAVGLVFVLIERPFDIFGEIFLIPVFFPTSLSGPQIQQLHRRAMRLFPFLRCRQTYSGRTPG